MMRMSGWEEASWHGFGPGTFRHLVPYFNTEVGTEIDGVWLYGHCDPLQTTVEWGWLGAAAWLVIGGGAVLSNDDDFAKVVRELRNCGGTVKHEHPRIGVNSRLDTLQAVVLRAKLERLPRWNDERRAAAARYDGLLAGSDVLVLPKVKEGNESVWHLYVVQVPERDRVLAQLHDAGIAAGIHYPTPCHLQGAYRSLGYAKGSFPVAERAADEILSLPIYPGITRDQQQRVSEVLLRAI